MNRDEIIEAAKNLSDHDKHDILHAMLECLGTRTTSADGESSIIRMSDNTSVTLGEGKNRYYGRIINISHSRNQTRH